MFCSRSIVHLDADAFFASVEQAADPRLRGKPIAVGGEKRGIVASASYEARKFGIYTPMPTALARRLCPRLIIVPGDFEKYELFSRLMFSYAYDFTPDVEIGSIDEGYLDLTGARKPAPNIAEIIRSAIRQSLKLSVSEGIGSNKLISQIASKVNKPAAFQCVRAGGEAEFLAPLANKWLPGVGPKTATQLNAAGLSHIGQIARTPAELLGLVVGHLAPQLRNFARGLDDRPVVPVRAPAKSYGEQETFAADTTDEPFLEATLRRMADKLMAKVRADAKSIRTLTVKVRYNDMDEDQASASLEEPTDLETEIYADITQLLRKAWKRRVSLRLVSLKLSNVYEGRFRGVLALDAPARQHDAQQRLAYIVDELREKYGRAALMRGHDFVLREGKPAPGKLSPRHAEREVRSPKSEIRKKAENRNPKEYTPARAAFGFRPSAFGPSGFPGIPLNVHSYYSFLDSTLSIPAVIELAKQHGVPAIALTDRNSLHGAVEFSELAARAGIKAILGAEIEWQGRKLCLYVQNQTGYHNLCQILSEEGRPKAEGRSPKEGRNPKSEGAHSSSGSLRPSDFGLRTYFGLRPSDFGFPTDGLLAASPDAALAPFFPGRFYLAVHGGEDLEKLPAHLPGVAALPIHYGPAADRWKYDIVQSIRTLTLLRQAHPDKRLDGDYHFRAPADMARLFSARPDLLAHTHEIADRCSFALAPAKPQFPGYAPPDGSTPAAFLRRLVMEGLQRRYPEKHAQFRPQIEQELSIITDVGYEEYFLVMWDILQGCRRRNIEWITRGSAADSLVCYCLEISGVCPIRFDLYFRRFLNKERMALNKLPDIDVDFPHDRKDDVIDLIFQRFGREYTAVVGGFSTFRARSAFAEVAKVLGVSEYQVRRITERLPHFAHTADLAQALPEMPECRDLPLAEEPYRSALEMAHFLDGFPRYPKMHPCGVVLSRQPISQLVPCFTSAKGYPTTQFEMESVEAIGLVKMDILAQGGLAVMRDVREMLRQSPKVEIRSPIEGRNPKAEIRTGSAGSTALGDVPTAPQAGNSGTGQTASTSDFGFRPSFDLRASAFGPPAPSPVNLDALEPWEDPAVWELIASGNARAVHHIESPAMISLCRMCNVRDIDTLIAIVSVIRPGAANESHKMEFARRYQGLSPVRYPHPSLEPCLRSTYGLVVYEEHILQICELFAGLPPGRADVLRRALAKQKANVVAGIEIEFAESARRLGRTEPEIAEVWGLVSGFMGYAFCKAHSTAYGVEAYQAAWLKLHYPAHFMAAVLTNGKGFYSPLVYVLECHRLGITLLPPSVNEPGPGFTVKQHENPPADAASCVSPGHATRNTQPATHFGLRTSAFGLSIRVPLLHLKGLSRRTGENVLRERACAPFASLADFFLRVQPLNEEMEALIRVGAFDEFGQTRTAQYWAFKSICQSTCQTAKPRSTQEYDPLVNRKSQIVNTQLWLLPPGNLERLPEVPLAEPTRLQRLRNEEELLGYPASGHPLELFPEVAWNTYCPINRLGEHVGQQVVTCGLVIEQRLFHQVTGEPMKFITIADRTGIVETELFARTYKSYGLNTVRYRVLEITALVEPFENSRGFTLRVLRADKPRTARPK
ncbi:MAG TPA: DNA polymerase IV [Candidatus Acidoferrum sp.]|nr:DNA polymerase IV [Candidatus Acidoferrum sp.]